ncbi:MAG: hypothetical protein R3F30_09805 [Planctomycetota bacterium]
MSEYLYSRTSAVTRDPEPIPPALRSRIRALEAEAEALRADHEALERFYLDLYFEGRSGDPACRRSLRIALARNQHRMEELSRRLADLRRATSETGR